MPSNMAHIQNFSANNKYLILVLDQTASYTHNHPIRIHNTLQQVLYMDLKLPERCVPCRQIEPFTFAIIILQKLVQLMHQAGKRFPPI